MKSMNEKLSSKDEECKFFEKKCEKLISDVKILKNIFIKTKLLINIFL